MHPKAAALTVLIAGLAATFVASAAHAQETATTESGKKVLLKDDGTWEYVEDDEEKDSEKSKGKSTIVTGAKNKPKIMPGKPIVTGSLDKKIIRRVVSQHRREVRYCYEKELLKESDLAGRITVKFTISGNGDVIAAMVTKSTMHNRDVESCISSKIRRWVFPEPKGGGIVVVKYPFHFSPKK